jgi:predicted transcriptional regulator
LAFLAAFLKERGLDVNDFLKKPEVKSKDLARVLEGSELPLPISIFKLAIFTLRKKENGNG